MSIEMIPPDTLRPNPYRRMDRYVIDEAKIEALLQSYEQSGFWDGSIQGRRKNGLIQIAFGHHRVEAAKRKGIPRIGVVVAERSNSDMLRMMADENRAEFKHDARVSVETIRAVVEAYARGEIELEAIEGHGANQQKYSLPNGKQYNLSTIARFLGWTKPSDGQATSSCRIAFDAYQSEDTTKSALDSLEPQQRSETAVKTVIGATRAARDAAKKAQFTPVKIRQAEKRAAEIAVEKIKHESGHGARDLATEIGKSAAKEIADKKPKAGPDAEVYILKLIQKCKTANPFAEITKEATRLIPFVNDLNSASCNQLADALDELGTRCATGIHALAKAFHKNDQSRVIGLLKGDGE